MSDRVYLSDSPSHRFSSPRVSVLIPTYNREDLVCHAIESVIKQSYQNFEIVVVDDGSTDNTRVHLQRFTDRIKYLYQANGGVAAALNAGIRAARGEWIAVLHSDDSWHPAKLEKQIEAVESLGVEFGACFTDCEFAYPGETHATAFQSSGLKVSSPFGTVERPLTYMTGSRYAFLVPSILVRRSLMDEIGGFDEVLAIAEDRDLVYRLSFKTRFCYVSGQLATIDRNPVVPRLSELCSERRERVFTWNERVRTRALDQPELKDQEVRHAIEQDLMELYYGWAATAAKDLKINVMWAQIEKIRRLGPGYYIIWKTLVGRAVSKTLHAIRSRERERRLT